MILYIWVFFMLGEQSGNQGTPYVQITASNIDHDRRAVELQGECAKAYAETYPGHQVCDSGWCRQRVEVKPV